MRQLRMLVVAVLAGALIFGMTSGATVAQAPRRGGLKDFPPEAARAGKHLERILHGWDCRQPRLKGADQARQDRSQAETLARSVPRPTGRRGL